MYHLQGSSGLTNSLLPTIYMSGEQIGIWFDPALSGCAQGSLKYINISKVRSSITSNKTGTL